MLKFLALIGLLAILGAIGAGVFFFGGYFSVAATTEDPAAVNWALIKVRSASIDAARHRRAGGRARQSRDHPRRARVRSRSAAVRIAMAARS